MNDLDAWAIVVVLLGVIVQMIVYERRTIAIYREMDCMHADLCSIGDELDHEARWSKYFPLDNSRELRIKKSPK